MRELDQNEIDSVNGGGMPQCHAGDPAPYSGGSYSFAEYLMFYLMIK